MDRQTYYLQISVNDFSMPIMCNFLQVYAKTFNCHSFMTSLHIWKYFHPSLIVLSQKINDKLVTPFNPFPNKPWFSRVCSTGLLKTLCEKEKLLVTSNFSFSHSIFKPFREHSDISIKF